MLNGMFKKTNYVAIAGDLLKKKETTENSSKTLEEKILKLQEDKQNLADEILSGANASLSSMSKDELLELLNGN